MQLCTQKYITRRQRGVHFLTPPPPPLNPPLHSGGFRNPEKGVQPLGSAPANFWVVTPTSGTLEVRTESTLGLVKCFEISKELIHKCVTMPSCCCCMALLHNHLMDSCSCLRKNTLLAGKGGCICTPLTPPESATVGIVV